MEQKPEAIRQDHLNGMTYRAIAEKYQIDQRTAKRYADGNLPLSQLENRPFPSLLDSYESLIRARLEQGPVFASVIYRELKEQGYPGGYGIVNRRVQQIILENEAAGLYPPDTKRTHTSPPGLPIKTKISKEKAYATDHYRSKHP